jgi:Tfp pilus assembly protein PilV
MTLVEVFIALAIFIVVMTAIATFEANTFLYKNSISSSLSTALSSQNILKTMLVEIRESAPGANGAFPVVMAGSTTISFFSDPDNDNVQEQVTYSLIGTTLYKAVIDPTGNPAVYSVANQSTTTLITNVQNGISLPVFQYYDANYTGTSSPLTQPVTTTSVHLVKINLKLDTDPNRAPNSMTYSVQAGIRNLKTNL